ncbi:hypothetical protein [Prauserella flavalba]|uniref:hypothetical protein n=1 Tax=Prauserella flavalba TaxID=1477506 RepID=UPI0036E371A2
MALRFLAEKVETMRASMHDELAALNAGQRALAEEVRVHIPTIAVLVSRVDGHDREIQALKATHAQEQAAATARQQWSLGLKVSAGIAALALLATVVIGVLNLTGGA